MCICPCVACIISKSEKFWFGGEWFADRSSIFPECHSRLR